MTVLRKVSHHTCDRIIRFIGIKLSRRNGNHLTNRVCISKDFPCKRFRNNHRSRSIQNRFGIPNGQRSIEESKEGTVAFKTFVYIVIFFVVQNNATPHGSKSHKILNFRKVVG